jgi:uncharacterized membrane protein YiaA
MNKVRILGIILFLLGFFLMYKTDNSESGFFINALIGIITTLGFFLTVFGNFNFKSKI